MSDHLLIIFLFSVCFTLLVSLTGVATPFFLTFEAKSLKISRLFTWTWAKTISSNSHFFTVFNAQVFNFRLWHICDIVKRGFRAGQKNESLQRCHGSRLWLDNDPSGFRCDWSTKIDFRPSMPRKVSFPRIAGSSSHLYCNDTIGFVCNL